MKKVWGVALVVAGLVASLLPVTQVAARTTNDFTITSYDIAYTVSRDEQNHSVLTTVETITAVFPEEDQNRGLERAYPTNFNGHSTSLKIDAVSQDGNTAAQYSTDTSGGVLVLRIGNPSVYVHGPITYQITSTQRDVTRSFANTGKDEWYWDTNGTEWRVPIEKLSVSVAIDEALQPSLQGDPYCYEGVMGSTDRCTVAKNEAGLYNATVGPLKSGENMTLAFGFTKGTFAEYQQPLSERLFALWLLVQPFVAVLGVVILLVLSVQLSKRSNRDKELQIIPTEYIPPKNTSVLTSAQVVTPKGSAFSGQLIDLAVRHKVAIIETKPKSFWTPAEYDITIVSDPSVLLAEEQEVLSDMFGALPTVGERLALKTLQSNMAYALRTADNDGKMKQAIEGEYALRHKNPVASRYFYRWSIALLVLAVLTLSPFVLFFAGFVALYGVTLRPLTDKGLELRRYLLGLERYIRLAEKERLKVLQGPETAQKIGESVDPNNPGQLVKLYERVLPYAILFGHEKEWSKRLGEFYTTTNTSPDWYTGQAAFNGAMFGAMIGSFSQSSSYSAGSSSSSGGSSGGGSSGGGGGGGGGGGW